MTLGGENGWAARSKRSPARPSAGCSGQSRSLGWMERARALPVRGQGFSHLEQQRQAHRARPASFRPGERTSATEEVVMPDRHFRAAAPRTWSTTASRPSTCCARRRRGMRPPGTGRPRCWATGPPGGSCSATPSSSWPRNTDSGPGPSSGRTSRASAPPATGRSSACGRRGAGDYASWADGLLTELRRGDPDALQRLRACVPRYAAATDASTAELRDARLVVARELGFPTWRELVEGPRKPSAMTPNARRSGGACARRPRPCWPATPPGWPS